jgi:hypothetical protein
VVCACAACVCVWGGTLSSAGQYPVILCGGLASGVTDAVWCGLCGLCVNTRIVSTTRDIRVVAHRGSKDLSVVCGVAMESGLHGSLSLVQKRYLVG